MNKIRLDSFSKTFFTFGLLFYFGSNAQLSFASEPSSESSEDGSEEEEELNVDDLFDDSERLELEDEEEEEEIEGNDTAMIYQE